MTHSSIRFLRGAVFAGCVGLLMSPSASAQEINLYTTREPALIQPLIDSFTKSSGITVKSIFVRDALAEHVAGEGATVPPDVLMTVDIGALVELVDKGLTQPVQSAVLEKAVPANLRGSNGEWFALSLRARVLYTHPGLDLPSFTYEQLADPRWKGKICTRAGQHPYNVGLIAAYIARHGEAKAETWLNGVKAGLARKAAGGDRDGARDILQGTCEIAIGNSYYVGLMRSGAGGSEQQHWGAAIKVVLPVFEGGGTHVNVSGASIAKNAPNKAAAIRFLEHLVSDEAQKIYAEANYEYPVKAGVAVHPIISALGALNVDSISLTDVARQRAAAIKLVEKVQFDQ